MPANLPTGLVCIGGLVDGLCGQEGWEEGKTEVACVRKLTAGIFSSNMDLTDQWKSNCGLPNSS